MDEVKNWILGIGGVCTLIVSSKAIYDGWNYYKCYKLKDLRVQELINDSEKNSSKTICVSGIVSDKNSFKPKYFKDYGKIVYSETTEDRYSQFGWPRTIHDRVINQFSLSQGKSEIIISPSNTTLIYTNTIYFKREELSPSWDTILQGAISIGASWFGWDIQVPVEIYHEIEEKVIPCNSVITAIGKFSKTDGKIIVIPGFLGFSKIEILKHLRKRLWLVCSAAVILGCIFVVPLINRFRKRRESTNQYREVRENIAEGFHCVICMENPRDTLIEPCKHLCVCRICCESLDQCPICRTHIEHSVRIFYP